MTAVNYASYALIHGLPPAAAQPAATPAQVPATAPAAAGDTGFTFDDLLDVVNPLQHIPVVSTLYRAITGDTIKTLPKIAGDALYGGLPGLASSVADTVFEKITGKNFGDTVLGYVEELFGPDTPKTMALQAPAGAPQPVDQAALALSAPTLNTSAPTATLQAPASQAALAPPALDLSATAADSILVPGQDALLLSLSRNGIGQDIAMRAADAYRRTLSTASDPALHGMLN